MSRHDKRERRHRDSSRRRSPSDSDRSLSPKAHKRGENELPESFGRVAEEVPEDESNVLQRMKKNFTRSPLGAIVKCLDEKRKIKIWTRNFKEVRGICTGYVIAFDKHWNIMMTDVDEVYVKPKKAKSPFLDGLKSAENFKELPKKGPRKKKGDAGTEKGDQENKSPTQKEAEKPKETEKTSNEGGEKKKKKRKKKPRNSDTTTRRHVQQMFVRGDNIVMIAVLDEDD